MAPRLFGVVLVLALFVVHSTEGWNPFCQLNDIIGTWTLKRDLSVTDDYTECWRNSYPSLEHRITLSYPDLATDEYGNYGHWTTIFGISVEITIHGRKYYSFFDWSYKYHQGWQINCNQLEVGSSRDILTNNYACFSGSKRSAMNETHSEDPTTTPAAPTFLRHDPIPTVAPKGRKLKNDAKKEEKPKRSPTDEKPTFRSHDPIPTDAPKLEGHQKMKVDYDLIDSINNNDLHLWEAGTYDHLLDLTEDELIMMAGGNMSLRGRPPKPAPVTDEQLLKLKYFPKKFDWRNVDGTNYVSPVRNQGYCGSCYAFAALGSYESRIRIMTKNTVTPVLSPQDIVNCSPYAYGCQGGWIFTEGMYAEEFGFVDEACNAYSADREHCDRDVTCKRYYGTDYQFVGGYFGGSNDILMMDAILNNGPIVVGMAIYRDFFYYRRGVYYHSGPDHLMGYHAVVVVGWDQDERSGTRYWIVKNSWGRGWGEDGYFNIVRGSNDCDIEAEAFETFPII